MSNKKFQFVGFVDNFDGNTIIACPEDRLPYKVGLFTTTGEGHETRVDQQAEFSFDKSFVMPGAPLREVLKDAGRLRVTIETVEEEESKG